MNKKEDIENYILNLYRKTKNFSFEKFIEEVFHYNIKIGDYNKPLVFDLQKYLFNSLKEDINKKPEIKYWDTSEWSNSFILFDKYFKYYNKIVLDLPFFDYDLDKICPTIVNFIIYNGITAKISIRKKIKNPSFKIEVYDLEDVIKINNFIETNNKTSNIVKSRVVPFLIQKDLIGIYREYDPYDFKNFYIKNLYEYFSLCIEEKEVSVNKFKEYLNKIYRFENNPNKKRMLNFLIDYIYMYDNLENYTKLFNLNKSLKLSGYNCNDYMFNADENGNMEFVLKEDNNIVIKYGSMDFYNLIYSKFYENNFRTQDSDRIYDDFCGIYDNLLSKDFENIDMILNLVNNNKMNMTYKIMYIIASGYFAHRKFGISFEIIKDITNKLISKLKRENVEENKSYDLGNKYILDNEYGNRIINLKNGSMTTIKDYFKKNEVNLKIKPEDIIRLKNGESTNGRVFLDNIYKIINKYDSFDELFKNEIKSIESQNN